MMVQDRGLVSGCISISIRAVLIFQIAFGTALFQLESAQAAVIAVKPPAPVASGLPPGAIPTVRPMPLSASPSSVAVQTMTWAEFIQGATCTRSVPETCTSLNGAVRCTMRANVDCVDTRTQNKVVIPGAPVVQEATGNSGIFPSVAINPATLPDEAKMNFNNPGRTANGKIVACNSGSAPGVEPPAPSPNWYDRSVDSQVLNSIPAPQELVFTPQTDILSILDQIKNRTYRFPQSGPVSVTKPWADERGSAFKRNRMELTDYWLNRDDFGAYDAYFETYLQSVAVQFIGIYTSDGKPTQYRWDQNHYSCYLNERASKVVPFGATDKATGASLTDKIAGMFGFGASFDSRVLPTLTIRNDFAVPVCISKISAAPSVGAPEVSDADPIFVPAFGGVTIPFKSFTVQAHEADEIGLIWKNCDPEYPVVLRETYLWLESSPSKDKSASGGGSGGGIGRGSPFLPPQGCPSSQGSPSCPAGMSTVDASDPSAKLSADNFKGLELTGDRLNSQLSSGGAVGCGCPAGTSYQEAPTSAVDKLQCQAGRIASEIKTFFGSVPDSCESSPNSACDSPTQASCKPIDCKNGQQMNASQTGCECPEGQEDDGNGGCKPKGPPEGGGCPLGSEQKGSRCVCIDRTTVLTAEVAGLATCTDPCKGIANAERTGELEYDAQGNITNSVCSCKSGFFYNLTAVKPSCEQIPVCQQSEFFDPTVARCVSKCEVGFEYFLIDGQEKCLQNCPECTERAEDKSCKPKNKNEYYDGTSCKPYCKGTDIRFDVGAGKYGCCAVGTTGRNVGNGKFTCCPSDYTWDEAKKSCTKQFCTIVFRPIGVPGPGAGPKPGTVLNNGHINNGGPIHGGHNGMMSPKPSDVPTPGSTSGLKPSDVPTPGSTSNPKPSGTPSPSSTESMSFLDRLWGELSEHEAHAETTPGGMQVCESTSSSSQDGSSVYPGTPSSEASPKQSAGTSSGRPENPELPVINPSTGERPTSPSGNPIVPPSWSSGGSAGTGGGTPGNGGGTPGSGGSDGSTASVNSNPATVSLRSTNPTVPAESGAGLTLEEISAAIKELQDPDYINRTFKGLLESDPSVRRALGDMQSAFNSFHDLMNKKNGGTLQGGTVFKSESDVKEIIEHIVKVMTAIDRFATLIGQPTKDPVSGKEVKPLSNTGLLFILKQMQRSLRKLPAVTSDRLNHIDYRRYIQNLASDTSITTVATFLGLGALGRGTSVARATIAQNTDKAIKAAGTVKGLLARAPGSNLLRKVLGSKTGQILWGSAKGGITGTAVKIGTEKIAVFGSALEWYDPQKHGSITNWLSKTGSTFWQKGILDTLSKDLRKITYEAVESTLTSKFPGLRSAVEKVRSVLGSATQPLAAIKIIKDSSATIEAIKSDGNVLSGIFRSSLFYLSQRENFRGIRGHSAGGKVTLRTTDEVNPFRSKQSEPETIYDVIAARQKAIDTWIRSIEQEEFNRSETLRSLYEEANRKLEESRNQMTEPPVMTDPEVAQTKRAANNLDLYPLASFIPLFNSLGLPFLSGIAAVSVRVESEVVPALAYRPNWGSYEMGLISGYYRQVVGIPNVGNLFPPLLGRAIFGGAQHVLFREDATCHRVEYGEQEDADLHKIMNPEFFEAIQYLGIDPKVFFEGDTAIFVRCGGDNHIEIDPTDHFWVTLMELHPLLNFPKGSSAFDASGELKDPIDWSQEVPVESNK